MSEGVIPKGQKQAVPCGILMNSGSIHNTSLYIDPTMDLVISYTMVYNRVDAGPFERRPSAI